MKQLSKINILMIVLSLFSLSMKPEKANAQETYSPFYMQGNQENTTSQKENKTTAVSSVLNITTAATTEDTHPFAGSEKQMEELDKLEPINTDLKVAVDTHNMLNRLRNYQNIQKQYNNAVKLHDRTVELLKDSEQCTINYMGRYFNDPVKVWSGKDMSDKPENHDLRQGLSAWAIALFETAKSAEVSPIDVEDVVSVDINTTEQKDESGNVLDVSTSITSDTSTIGMEVKENNSSEDVVSLENIQKSSDSQIDNLQEQTGGNYFKDPSRQEELEAEDRKTDLISKDIGSEVALWMADYLSGYSTSEGPDWSTSNLGGVKKRFPVWTDQKTFYGQYLIRKYKNIKNYIKNYTVQDDVKERISDRVLERQKEYMNEADAQITQAAVQARLMARNTYDTNVAKAYDEYQKELERIENERSSKINTLNAEKEKKVAQFDKEIKEINQKRDQYMNMISDINEENSLLSAEIKDLEQEIAGYNSMMSGSSITEEQRSEYEENISEINAEISSIRKTIERQNTNKERYQREYNKQTQLATQKEQEKVQYISDVQKQIGEINQKAKEEKEAALKIYKEKVQEQEQDLAEKNQRIDAAETAAKLAIQSNSMITAQQIISETDLIIEDTKETAYENIDKTLSALKALGDDLYRGKIQDTIASYHQALIDSFNGKEGVVAGTKLEAVGAKIHDLTNYNVDIVISSHMDEQMRELYLSNYRDAVKNTNVLLTIPLLDKMLDGVYTGVDSQYFVGSQPKKEDFTAPKAMPDYNLPPLREYVRLDYVDLQAIGVDMPKLEVGEYKMIFPNKVWIKSGEFPVSVIDKEEFLSYGGKIPEIWKLMLKDKAFVDSDFYLTPEMAEGEEGTLPPEYNPLRLGAEMSPLYRGGIYPCILKNIKSDNGICSASGTIDNGTGVVDVAVIDKGKTNADEYFMGLSFVTGDRKSALLSQGLPTCQEVSAKCKITKRYTIRGPETIVSPSLTLLNSDEESGNSSDSFVSEGDASELGSILNVYSGKMLSDGSYVKNVLGYSPYMQSVVNYGKRMEERGQQEDAEELNATEQQNDDIYVRAQYNNNQVGDFLDHVELEQKYKQALDDLEEQVKENKEELYTSLREYGFEPSADFDISRKEDYDLAVKKLKEIKNNYMAKAKSGIDSIEPGTSDVLNDSKNSYSRIYQGLMLDSEAVVTMTMDVENVTDFIESVKTATVNREVDDTYEENGDESFEETLRALKPAYCAAY